MSQLFPFGRASGGEPTPVLPVVLSNRKGKSTPVLTAIVDTGADGTLAPLDILTAAGFRAGRQQGRLRTGRTDVAPEVVRGYTLTLHVGSLELHYVDVFSSRLIQDVVLGRDVLNQLVFTYDGPRRLLDILEP
ncbi:MAG: retroviral-like aspartic protease family protein [Chloroflexi bacterium]|nr:retroviral-like aspartic protease family protein [Chloroflexota bacterium]